MPRENGAGLNFKKQIFSTILRGSFGFTAKKGHSGVYVRVSVTMFGFSGGNLDTLFQSLPLYRKHLKVSDNLKIVLQLKFMSSIIDCVSVELFCMIVVRTGCQFAV